MRIFRLWPVAVARAYWRHWLAWVVDADLLHHSTVFMAEDVAVEHEVTNNARPREWNHDLHFAADRHGESISVHVERLRNSVDLQDLEVKLVNVEDMQFVRGVANDPLLIVAVTDQLIDARSVEIAIVDTEVVGSFAKDDGASHVRRHLAQVIKWAWTNGRLRQGDWICNRIAHAHHGQEILSGVPVAVRSGTNLRGVQLVAAGLVETHHDFNSCTGGQWPTRRLGHLHGGVAIHADHPEFFTAEVKVVVNVG